MPLPRPLGADEPPRKTGSRLEARRWATLLSAMWVGTGGTGGAFGSAGLPLPGDAARNERSVMEPELDWRCSPGGGGRELLPLDEVELRRIMRLVTVSPTAIGVGRMVRRAWVAAALERMLFASRSRAKALVAARDAGALGMAGARWGCIGGEQDVSILSISTAWCSVAATEQRGHLPDSTLPVASCQTWCVRNYSRHDWLCISGVFFA